MSLKLLIVIYLFIEAVSTHLYFKKCAVIDVSKKTGIDISPQVLPPIFNTYYALINVAKIYTLSPMFFTGHWIVGVCIGVGFYVLTSLLPVPKYYYDEVYKELNA